MKFKAYINVDGLERVALGNPLYSWHMGVMTGEDELPEGAWLVCAFEAALPKPAECIQPVLTKLAQREANIQAEAYKDVQAIRERRENLLSLTYTTPTVLEVKESEL